MRKRPRLEIICKKSWTKTNAGSDYHTRRRQDKESCILQSQDRDSRQSVALVKFSYRIFFEHKLLGAKTMKSKIFLFQENLEVEKKFWAEKILG